MMNEAPHSDDSLDRWLKSQAELGTGSVEADGWDMPSPQVWAQVRAHIDQRKKKKRLLWWLFPGMLAAGLLTAWANGSIRLRKTTYSGVVTEIQGRQSQEQIKAEIPVIRGNKFISKTTKVFDNQQDKRLVAFGSAPSGTRENEDSVGLFALFVPIQKNEVPINEGLQKMPSGLPEPLSFLPQTTTNLNLPRRNGTEPIKVKQENARKGAWYCGVGVSSFFTYRLIRDQSGVVQQSGGPDLGAWTLQQQWIFGLRLNRRFALETGLQHAAVRYLGKHNGKIRYRADQEQYDAENQVFVSSIDQTLETGTGAAELRFDLLRQPGQVIPDNSKIRVNLRSDEQLRYLRLPVALRFELTRNRWTVSAMSGLGLNLRTAYALDARIVDSEPLAVRNFASMAARRAAGTTDFYTDAQAGLSLAYILHPQWKMQFGFEYRYGLGPIFDNGNFRSSPVSAGFNLGLIWRPALR